jgi:hypothetical protein
MTTMSKVLTTFSGKYGDILWALPTVRAVANFMAQEKVDFGIMPQYRSLLPLLNFQTYIDKAFVIEDWECTGSPYGDQPWLPQHVPQGYERAFHLTYRGHPGIHCAPLPLIDFIAEQQGMRLVNPIPFIDVPAGFFRAKNEPEINCHAAYAFSAGAAEAKAKFLDIVIGQAGNNIAWIDASKEDWMTAALLIKLATCFVGSRSSNNVIAHGVGQKNIFIYEPESSRHASGPFGMVFGCPYDEETTAPVNATPEQAAELAVRTIQNWQEQTKEVVK